MLLLLMKLGEAKTAGTEALRGTIPATTRDYGLNTGGLKHL